jgi:hypothetical protein
LRAFPRIELKYPASVRQAAPPIPFDGSAIWRALLERWHETARCWLRGALSERERMTDQRPEPYRLLELFRPAALVVLTAFSGVVVWSFHNFGWPGFVAYLLVGFVAGSVTGGLVGVPLPPTWAVMAAGSLFEGAYQGWQHYGWVGAVLGGLVGVVGGIVVALLLTMLMSLVLVMCGSNPFVNADEGQGQKSDAT